MKPGDVVIFRPPAAYVDNWLRGREIIPYDEVGIVKELLEGKMVSGLYAQWFDGTGLCALVGWPFLVGGPRDQWFPISYFEVMHEAESR